MKIINKLNINSVNKTYAIYNQLAEDLVWLFRSPNNLTACNRIENEILLKKEDNYYRNNINNYSLAEQIGEEWYEVHTFKEILDNLDGLEDESENR